MSAIEKYVSRAIIKMERKSLELEGTGQWVVEDDLHVFVGWKSEFALGNTDFAIKSAIPSSKAKVFKTREDAIRAAGKGCTITDAAEFFRREIEDAKKALDFIIFLKPYDLHEMTVIGRNNKL